MPRLGIEPSISRLKAGGFAVEACEACERELGVGTWNKQFRHGFFAPRSAFPKVPGAGIEPAASTFKEWLQYQH